jgi:hypothetical protein
VAAPLFRHGDQLVAAVSVAGTIQQIPKRRMKNVGAMLQRYAERMSARLGTRSSIASSSLTPFLSQQSQQHSN